MFTSWKLVEKVTLLGEGEFLCSLILVVRSCATPSSYLLLVSDLQPPVCAANCPHRVIFKVALYLCAAWWRCFLSSHIWKPEAVQKCSSVLFIELGQRVCLKSDLDQDSVCRCSSRFSILCGFKYRWWEEWWLALAGKLQSWICQEGKATFLWEFRDHVME